MKIGERTDNLRFRDRVMGWLGTIMAQIQSFTLHITPLGMNLQVPKPGERQRLLRTLLVQMRCILNDYDASRFSMANGPNYC